MMDVFGGVRQRQRRRGKLSGAVATSVYIPRLQPGLTRRFVLGAVIPGDSIVETTVVGGTVNFFNIYQNVLILRIVSTWFPGVAQSQVFRPIVIISDPFLGLFRRVVPPLFGALDLSPVLALLVLQSFGSATAALSAELPLPPPTSTSTHSAPLCARRARR